jgi:hypothetical protein
VRPPARLAVRVARRDNDAPSLSANLVQAKALIFCALPYSRIQDRSVTRRARIGRNAFLTVTFASIEPGVPLPYGADRALLGWIQTLCYHDRFVSFDTLTQFFRAFGLSDCGREYARFRGRLERLMSLALSVRLDEGDTSARVAMQPLKKSVTPRTPRDVRLSLAAEAANQLVLLKNRWGFELDPDFHAYLRANPVPMPLALMRRFRSQPKAWDFAQFVLFRSFSASAPSIVPWNELLSQMASQDGYPRRLKLTLARVLEEIRSVYRDFPARFLPAWRGLQISPWRPRSA